jgi:zinc transport system substrate-binding protein
MVPTLASIMTAMIRSVISIFTLWLIGLGSARAEVATSIPPLACLVKSITGDTFKVESILPPGANHETFEPGLAQLKGLLHSNLVISTGHPFFTAEAAWVKRIKALNKDAKSVKLFDNVCGSTAKCPDPHIWVSTRLFPDLLRGVAEALRGVDFNQKIIDSGFATTMAQFEASLGEAQRLLEPFRGKSFLTYHSAWPYFSDEFGFTELSLEKGGKEVGMAGLNALIGEVRSSGIKTLFVESVESSTSAASFADSNKLRLVELNPIAVDCVDFPRLVAEKLAASFNSP